MKPAEWREKHKSLEKKKKSDFPDVGKYNPFPQAYKTFGYALFVNDEEKKRNGNRKSAGPGRTNGFGTDTRFKDIKTTKSKEILNVPGPGMYDLVAYWQGKEEGAKKANKGPAKKDWNKLISKGVEKNIYYGD